MVKPSATSICGGFVSSSCGSVVSTFAAEPRGRSGTPELFATVLGAEETSIRGKWKVMYDKLKDFKEEKGHCRVPVVYAKDPRLGRWVAQQRNDYRRRNATNKDNSNATCLDHDNQTAANIKNGADMPDQPKSVTDTDIGKAPSTVTPSKKSRITQDQIDALNALDFVWHLPSSTWDDRFNDLCNYKSIHGDCLVPLHYPENPKLAAWVRGQRKLYSNYVKGKKRKVIKEERIEALESIGFVWFVNRERWNLRYDELVDFQAMHGHCIVPEHYPPHPSLGLWVVQQRYEYKRFLAGEASSLTNERIAELNKVGFRWDDYEYRWTAMFERVKKYKEENGGFKIPGKEIESRSLNLWIKAQRAEYRKLKHQKKSRLTPKRKAALESIDFPFVRKGKYPSLKDWERLFEELRKRGIDERGKVKRHIFDGEDRFVDVKTSWTDEELLELWNQEEDDDDM